MTIGVKFSFAFTTLAPPYRLFQALMTDLGFDAAQDFEPNKYSTLEAPPGCALTHRWLIDCDDARKIRGRNAISTFTIRRTGARMRDRVELHVCKMNLFVLVLTKDRAELGGALVEETRAYEYSSEPQHVGFISQTIADFMTQGVFPSNEKLKKNKPTQSCPKETLRHASSLASH